MATITGKHAGSISAPRFSHSAKEPSTGVLLPRTQTVLSRFATSAQTVTQMPLCSMHSDSVAHVKIRRLLHATATKITSIANRLATDRTTDIENALDRWKAGQASIKTEPDAVLLKRKATHTCDDEVLSKGGLADNAARHDAARALARGAKWLKRADRSAFLRMFSNTPFHGFSRLPSQLRVPNTQTNNISASIAADILIAAATASASGSFDVELSLKKEPHHEAQKCSSTSPSRQLQKVFFLIDKMQRVDRIALQRGRHMGLHSGGLTSVISGAASAFLARIGLHVGIAIQRSQQFFLYMNESWLEMQFNIIEGTEAELGVSAGLGVADASPLDDVQVRTGITVRVDAVSVQKEQIKGIVIRIPCKWENKLGPEYDARVHKAKETAKQILLLLQDSGRDREKPDGYHILDKLSSLPEFSEVSIQPIRRAIRQRSSSKLSIDGGFAVRATRVLFSGVMVRLGLERVWREKSLHDDPSLKLIKEGKSMLASVGGSAGLSVGESASVSAPFEAFGGVQGALARDEEGLHMREVDGAISPWSFREVAFSDPGALTAYVKRWCEVHGRQTYMRAGHQASYEEWEQDLFKQLKTWHDAQSVSSSGHKEFDYTYAARFRLTPEALNRLNVLNNCEKQAEASVDNLLKACEISRQETTNPALLRLPTEQRMSEVKRLGAIDAKNKQSLSDALSQLRQHRAERFALSRSIDSFGAPVLYAYKNASHKEILGLRMLLGLFARTTVVRRDTATVMKSQTLQAYIEKQAR